MALDSLMAAMRDRDEGVHRIVLSYNSGPSLGSMRVGIATAKNSLPKLIRLAEQGEEVILTRHGKPVAQISSLPPELRRQNDAPDAWLVEVVSPAYLRSMSTSRK
jgi:prevent-host-death family protein